MSHPDVGDLAPDFELRCVTGARSKTFRLHDSRGQKHVVMSFHVADWTPV